MKPVLTEHHLAKTVNPGLVLEPKATYSCPILQRPSFILNEALIKYTY